MTELEKAEAELKALENPPEGQPKGSPREIDAAAQRVLDLREAADKGGVGE